MRNTLRWLFWSVPLSILAFSSTSNALDTTEPFDIGFSDYEFYVGAFGLGLDEGERTFAWESVIGIGITRSFSAGFAYAMESDEYFNSQDDSFTGWLFWTPLDRERVDIDLFAGYATGGAAFFGLEFNLDFPRWGFQLVLDDVVENKGTPADERTSTFTFAPLFYFNAIPDKMQLLAQIDWSYNDDVADDEDELTTGAAALGMNIVVHEAVELITQLDIDITDDDEEETSWGLSVGFVATLPAGGS